MFFPGLCMKNKHVEPIHQASKIQKSAIIASPYTKQAKNTIFGCMGYRGKTCINNLIKNYCLLAQLFASIILITTRERGASQQRVNVIVTVICQLLVTSYQVSGIRYQVSVISYQLSVISYQLSVISYQLLVISYQLSVTSFQLPVIEKWGKNCANKLKNGVKKRNIKKSKKKSWGKKTKKVAKSGAQNFYQNS